MVARPAAMDSSELLRAPPNEGRMFCETEHETELWQPIAPGEKLEENLWFVDGVQRQEAVVSTLDNGRMGAAGGVGAVAAGGVEVVAGYPARFGLVRSQRVLCSPTGDLPFGRVLEKEGIVNKQIATGQGKIPFGSALERQRETLEGDTVRAAQATGRFVLVDGLYAGSHGRTVGMAKRQRRKYLTDEQYRIIAGLEPGHRTPMFHLPAGGWSWYLRLERNQYGQWGGILRLETGASFPDAKTLADIFAVWLPPFRSRPLMDPRAPENQRPIAALEKHLRKRLGNPGMVQRKIARVSKSLALSDKQAR